MKCSLDLRVAKLIQWISNLCELATDFPNRTLLSPGPQHLKELSQQLSFTPCTSYFESLRYFAHFVNLRQAVGSDDRKNTLEDKCFLSTNTSDKRSRENSYARHVVSPFSSRLNSIYSELVNVYAFGNSNSK